MLGAPGLLADPALGFVAADGAGLLRGGGVPDLQGVHLAAVDALLVDWRGQGRVDLPGGAGVVRTSGTLTLLPARDRGGPPSAPDDLEEPDS